MRTFAVGTGVTLICTVSETAPVATRRVWLPTWRSAGRVTRAVPGKAPFSSVVMLLSRALPSSATDTAVPGVKLRPRTVMLAPGRKVVPSWKIALVVSPRVTLSTTVNGTLKVIGSVSRSPVVVKNAPDRMRSQCEPLPNGPALVRLLGAWIQPSNEPLSAWSVTNQYLASDPGGSVVFGGV